MSYLGLHKARAILISEINTLEIVINNFLAKTENFGIGSAFSKGPRSAFSEDLGPSLSSLYKLCPNM